MCSFLRYEVFDGTADIFTCKHPTEVAQRASISKEQLRRQGSGIIVINLNYRAFFKGLS